jgi:pilus assembly protein CpaF
MSSLEISVQREGGQQRYLFAAIRRVWLGRDPSCEVVLSSELVSRRHAWLQIQTGGIQVADSSANGTGVDGERLHRHSRLAASCVDLELGPHRLCARIVELPASVAPAPAALRRRVQRSLLDHLDLRQLDPRKIDREALRPKVLSALEAICDELRADLPPGTDRAALIRELADEALGLGPLEGLLSDPAITEVMVVDPQTIYVERHGVIEPTELRFTDDEAVRATIERIVSPLGRRIDESAPLVDARLPDGSRVNAIIPPLASRGPCITIRKFTAGGLGVDDLVERGSLTRAMAQFLCAVVRARKNLVISGGTGSGKTTLLNVLSSAIPERERIVTIEDAAELCLRQPHVVSLEARPPNLEGKGAYTIRDLVRNALRMRPDRIIVGECRGGEAIDMLQAMNTGHEGSMTTTHANSPLEAVARLEVLCLMAGLDLPARAVRQQIAASVHVIVQQARFADGSRRVTSIGEMMPLDEHGEVELRELYRFDRSAGRGGRVGGSFLATGHVASFAAELERVGHGGGER